MAAHTNYCIFCSIQTDIAFEHPLIFLFLLGKACGSWWLGRTRLFLCLAHPSNNIHISKIRFYKYSCIKIIIQNNYPIYVLWQYNTQEFDEDKDHEYIRKSLVIIATFKLYYMCKRCIFVCIYIYIYTCKRNHDLVYTKS